jgi:hypothetical protein
MKKINDFTKWISQLSMIKLSTVDAISEQYRCHRYWRTPKVSRGVHTFCLDSTLLDLKVCSSIFIHLKVSTRSAHNPKMQWWLIGVKMLWSSLKKIRCKHLMWVANLCRYGVSQLDGGDYSSWGGWKRHIHSPVDVYLIS